MIERDAFAPQEFATFDKSAGHLESNSSSIPLTLLGGGLLVIGLIGVYMFLTHKNEAILIQRHRAHQGG